MIASVTTTRNGQKYRVHKRQVRKQLTVAELTVGMYVVELDIPWEESPFLFQGFLLESEKDIHMVQDYCKTVWVDVVEDPAGIAYLELSDVVKSKKVALELARARGEKAIYDFANSETIYL